MPLRQTTDRKNARSPGRMLMLWLAVPAAAFTVLLVSVFRVSIPEQTQFTPLPDSGVVLRALWSEPDACRAGMLILNGPEGTLPGMRILSSELHRQGVALLQIPLTSGDRTAAIHEGFALISERFGDAIPVGILATGSAAPDALAFTETTPIDSLILLDPSMVPPDIRPALESMRTAILDTGSEENGTSLKILYESLSGDDTEILPSSSGKGRISSVLYLSPAGNALLAFYPDLPIHTGLAVPVFRETVLRWILPDNVPIADTSGLLPVYAALLLTAGALLPLAFPAIVRRTTPVVLMAFFTLFLPAVFGVVSRWYWNRPLLIWTQVAAGAGACAVVYFLDQMLSLRRRQGATAHSRMFPVLPVYAGVAVLVWLTGSQTSVLLLSMLGAAVCAWGYARVAGRLLRSRHLEYAAGAILLIMML